LPTLGDLQRRRLDLADTLRAILPVARAYRDEQREQEVGALLARLSAGRFQLAVIGQFSRGKTTLMNALLGHAYLPIGALPTTSVVTTVRYGPRSRTLVRGRATDLPLEGCRPQATQKAAGIARQPGWTSRLARCATP
jgi:Dynamin family